MKFFTKFFFQNHKRKIVFENLHWDSISGDSRIKKVGGGHCGVMKKVGGQHKCRLSCVAIFRCFEDNVSMINRVKPNVGL